MQPRMRRSSRPRTSSPRRPLAAALLALLPFAPAVVSPGRAESPFIRGDANASGDVDLSDAVRILLYLFHGEEAPPCLRAADLNVDARLDLSDPISILNFLFSGASPPPLPFPRCGYPPGTEEGLSCEDFAPCAQYETERIDFCVEPHDFVAVMPTSPESAPVTVLHPELFDAMDRLEEGEPLLALRHLPGFQDYLRTSPIVRSLRSLGWSEESYEPTVAMDALADPQAPRLVFDEDLLDELTWRLLGERAIDEGERIAEADPEEVRGAGKSPVLLVKEKPDGSRRTISCTVDLLPSDAPGQALPDNLILIDFRILPRIAADTEYGACGWEVRGFDPSPPEGHETGERRSWNVVGREERRAPWDGASVAAGEGGDGWYTFSGPGPNHRLYLRRWLANCLAPPTTSSHAFSGSISLQVRASCWSRGATKDLPRDCEAEVHAEAFYSSQVRVRTYVEGPCAPLGSEAIEAVAQDEALFTARRGGEETEELAFSKAVVVRTGSSRETKLAFELDPELQRGFEDGVASDLDTRFGFSITDGDRPGEADDALECQAALDMAAPACFRLQTRGEAMLNARHRAQGDADVRCNAAGILFVGTATGRTGSCLGNALGGWLLADTTWLSGLEEEGERFFGDLGHLEKIDWVGFKP